jgi:hypothetical protein
MKSVIKTETAMDRAVHALLGKTAASITSILVARFRKRTRRPARPGQRRTLVKGGGRRG